MRKWRQRRNEKVDDLFVEQKITGQKTVLRFQEGNDQRLRLRKTILKWIYNIRD